MKKKSLTLLLAVGVVALAAVLGSRGWFRGGEGTRSALRHPYSEVDAQGKQGSRTTEATESRLEGDERPDFTNVYLDAERLTDLGAAGARLVFTPVAPSAAGTPEAIIVHQAAPRRALQGLALTYDGPVRGRFVVREEPTQMTQQSLEGLPAQCAAASLCEGTWKVVTLADGTRALLVAGPGSTGIVWLRNNIRFYVLGPPDTFSIGSATAVADTFARAS